MTDIKKDEPETNNLINEKELETWWDDEEDEPEYPVDDDDRCPPRHWDAGV